MGQAGQEVAQDIAFQRFGCAGVFYAVNLGDAYLEGDGGTLGIAGELCGNQSHLAVVDGVLLALCVVNRAVGGSLGLLVSYLHDHVYALQCGDTLVYHTESEIEGSAGLDVVGHTVCVGRSNVLGQIFAGNGGCDIEAAGTDNIGQTLPLHVVLELNLIARHAAELRIQPTGIGIGSGHTVGYDDKVRSAVTVGAGSFIFHIEVEVLALLDGIGSGEGKLILHESLGAEGHLVLRDGRTVGLGANHDFSLCKGVYLI